LNGPPPDLEETLRLRLGGARTVAVLGVGDEALPMDRLGPMAARALELMGIPGVRVLPAGTTPESATGPVRRLRPDRVLLLDAADLGREPGEAAVVRPGDVGGTLPSSHGLPLTVLMEFLEVDVGVPVTLVGLQPDPEAVEGGAPTPREREAVARVETALAGAMDRG